MKKGLGLSKKLVAMLLLLTSTFYFAQADSKMLITFKNNGTIVSQGSNTNNTVEFGLTTNKAGTVNYGEGSSQYPPMNPDGGITALMWRKLGPNNESHYVDDFRDKSLESQVWFIEVGKNGTNLTLDFSLQTTGGLIPFPGDLYLFGNPQNSDYATYTPHLITNGKNNISIVPGGYYYISYVKNKSSVTGTNDLTVFSGDNFGATVANSRWRVSKDNQVTWGDWKSIGDTVSDLTGDVYISFDHVNGYATPPNYKITMDGDKSYMGVYLISVVNFEAVARFTYGTYVVDDEMKNNFYDLFQNNDFWKVKNNTTGEYVIDSYLKDFRFAIYNGKGGQKINLQNGSYTLEFPDVTGLKNLWTKPTNISFTVSNRVVQGVATPIIGTYNVVTPATIVASPNENISVILKGSESIGISERLTVTVSAAPTTDLSINVSGTTDITFSETAIGTFEEVLSLVFSTTETYPLTKSYYLKTLGGGQVTYAINSPVGDFRYTNIKLGSLTVNAVTESVDSDIKFSPTSLNFGALKVNENLRQWIIVTNTNSTTEKNVNIKTVANSQFKTNFKVTDAKVIDANNGSLAIAIDFKATGPGNYTDELILLTNGTTDVIAKCTLTATVSDATDLPRISVSPAVIVKKPTDITEGNVTYDLKVKVAAFANATTPIPFVITLPAGSIINTVPATGFIKDPAALTIAADSTVLTTTSAKTYTFNVTTPVTSENIYPLKISEILAESAPATMLLSDGQLAISNILITLTPDDVNVNGSTDGVTGRDFLMLYRYIQLNKKDGYSMFPGTPGVQDDGYSNTNGTPVNKWTEAGRRAKTKIDDLLLKIANNFESRDLLNINGSSDGVTGRDFLMLYRYIQLNKKDGYSMFPGTPGVQDDGYSAIIGTPIEKWNEAGRRAKEKIEHLLNLLN